MEPRAAIDLALDMIRRPIMTRTVQRVPLPQGVLEVIRIAADSEDDLLATSRTRGRTPAEIREAAVFFVEQALFCAPYDDYRVLGLAPGASLVDLREHRRWLLKWLHPDRNKNTWQSQFFQRVIKASENLERALTDETQSLKAAYASPIVRRRSRARYRRMPKRRKDVLTHRPFPNALRRVIYTLIAAMIVVVGWRAWNGEPMGGVNAHFLSTRASWLNW